ncbi:MAG: hypothetical protein MZV64_25725 [Ignavibacteriales bacterium]|nr:hypothetical protein [Ignavibacteriales bacterium]
MKFSDHPRARVIKIDCSEAEKEQGVIRIFTAKDIPGERKTGLVFQDWPLIVDEGEITSYIGDVLAAVVAESESIARKALSRIRIDYELLEAVTDMHEAIKPDSIRVHSGKSNVSGNLQH